MKTNHAKSGRTHSTQQEGKPWKQGSPRVATWTFVPVDDGAFYHVQIHHEDGRVQDLGDVAPPLAGRLINDLVRHGASLEVTA